MGNLEEDSIFVSVLAAAFIDWPMLVCCVTFEALEAVVVVLVILGKLVVVSDVLLSLTLPGVALPKGCASAVFVVCDGVAGAEGSCCATAATAPPVVGVEGALDTVFS